MNDTKKKPAVRKEEGPKAPLLITFKAMAHHAASDPCPLL